jgi:hypothetical protein
MSAATRFAQPLPPPKYVPPTSPDTVGETTRPTLDYEEWYGVEDIILAETNSWLATQAEDKVFLPPQAHERSAYSEAGIATQLAGQVDVVQKALNQAGLGVEWLQEPRKGSGSQAPSTRAGHGGVTCDPPVQDLEVEGDGLLKKPDFEMRQGGEHKTFLEIKVP